MSFQYCDTADLFWIFKRKHCRIKCKINVISVESNCKPTCTQNIQITKLIQTSNIPTYSSDSLTLRGFSSSSIRLILVLLYIEQDSLYYVEYTSVKEIHIQNKIINAMLNTYTVYMTLHVAKFLILTQNYLT